MYILFLWFDDEGFHIHTVETTFLVLMEAIHQDLCLHREVAWYADKPLLLFLFGSCGNINSHSVLVLSLSLSLSFSLSLSLSFFLAFFFSVSLSFVLGD